MRIRPYIHSKDYKYIAQWIDNEKVHAFWCANHLPYPVTPEAFRNLLEKNAMDWTDSAYVATKNDGKVTGFFCYSLNTENNTGFMKYIIVDKAQRGKGYGKEMLALALQYAFQITGATSVQLNVFNENISAKRCYEKAGFIEKAVEKNVFGFGKELWSRCSMIAEKAEKSP